MTDKYFNNTKYRDNEMEFLTPWGSFYAERENIVSRTWLVCIARPPNLDDIHAKIKREAYVTVSEKTNPIELYMAWVDIVNKK